MEKIVLIVIDGLGDRPIPQLGNRTPLEAAKTSNLDLMAEKGILGLLDPVFTAAIPTSEGGHFSLFGYDPKKYPVKRGIFTAIGAGMKMRAGDVALRGNFGTVDNELNMIDRRAGRIKNTNPLIDALDGMVIDGVEFSLRSAGMHRVALLLRGKGLSPNVSDGDPHYGKLGKKAKRIVALDKKSKFTAQVLNKFLKKSREILLKHPFNKKREFPADYILLRGASSLLNFPSFEKRYGLKACCIAGKPLYKGIGKLLGMNLIGVRGANGLPNTNVKGKMRAAKRSLGKYGFVFLHFKAGDSLAEDGDFKGKKEFIEKIDRNLSFLLNVKNALIVVTADHSTCSDLKRHCSEPIPILIFGNGKDSVSRFSERDCRKGKLGKIKQTELMKKVLAIAKK